MCIPAKVGYICPVCEDVHRGGPKLRYEKGTLIFTCHVTGEDWENTQNILKFATLLSSATGGGF